MEEECKIINCNYDDKNKCTGCKLEKTCLLKTGTNPTIQQVQKHIRDLLILIDMSENDLKNIDKIQTMLDSSYYDKKHNINGDNIKTVQDVANLPAREAVSMELDDLRYELKLYRQKELQLLKEEITQ